jgi:hypothetical protein
VPLGSAENSFGTGDLSLGVGSPTNIWAAVNGYCTSKENGDELLSKYDATYTGSTYDCPANPADPSTPHATTNYEYNPSGYIYDIQTPVQTQGTLSTDITVSAYDPSFNPGGCSNGETPDNSIGQSNTNITTSYSLYYAPTPLNPPSATNLLGTSTFVTNDSASCGKWVPIGTIPAGAANGTYQLEVSSQAGEANSEGTNGYGLEVNLGPFGAFQRCSTIPNPGWSNPNANNCPVIQGHNFLSVYANTAQSTGTFYLADVDSTYDGKTMNITLFDPGEGDHFIQILDPNGNPVHFTYQETDKCSSTPPLFPPPPNQNSTDCAGPSGIPFPQNTSDSGSSGPGTLSNGNTVPEVLDVSQQVSQPPGIASRSQFNDRHLQLTVTVPPGSDGWWQIKYYSTSSVSDRTTWSVSLQGSPIHLVP